MVEHDLIGWSVQRPHRAHKIQIILIAGDRDEHLKDDSQPITSDMATHSFLPVCPIALADALFTHHVSGTNSCTVIFLTPASRRTDVLDPSNHLCLVASSCETEKGDEHERRRV